MLKVYVGCNKGAQWTPLRDRSDATKNHVDVPLSEIEPYVSGSSSSMEVLIRANDNRKITEIAEDNDLLSKCDAATKELIHSVFEGRGQEALKVVEEVQSSHVTRKVKHPHTEMIDSLGCRRSLLTGTDAAFSSSMVSEFSVPAVKAGDAAYTSTLLLPSTDPKLALLLIATRHGFDLLRLWDGAVIRRHIEPFGAARMIFSTTFGGSSGGEIFEEEACMRRILDCAPVRVESGSPPRNTVDNSAEIARKINVVHSDSGRMGKLTPRGLQLSTWVEYFTWSPAMPSSGYSGALLSVVCVQSVSAGGKVQRKKESTHLDRIGMAIDKTIDDFAWNRRKGESMKKIRRAFSERTSLERPSVLTRARGSKPSREQRLGARRLRTLLTPKMAALTTCRALAVVATQISEEGNVPVPAKWPSAIKETQNAQVSAPYRTIIKSILTSSLYHADQIGLSYSETDDVYAPRCITVFDPPTCQGRDQPCGTIAICGPAITVTPTDVVPTGDGTYEPACDTMCQSLNDEASYCKWWLPRPTCLGGDQPCGDQTVCTSQTWPPAPTPSLPAGAHPYESAPCNAYCVGLNGPTSYCKWWKNEPVCQGGDQSCGPSDCPTGTPAPTEGPPDAHVGPSSNCDAYCTAINPDLSFDRVSYCKWWLHVPVCYDGDQPCGPSVCSNFGETTTPTTSIPSVTPTTQATTISSATSQIVTTQSATTLTPTTQVVTTVAPTTQAVTTATPTTQAVTTVTPTTQAVTTVAPTTQAVTTVAPTTQAVTTVPPTTQAVTTVAPTTPAGTTAAPTTQATTTPSSTSQTATTQSVTTVAATTQAATSVVATTQAVTTVPPTTQVVTTVAPTTQVVTTVAPTTQAVTTVAPTTQAVNTATPTTQATTIPSSTSQTVTTQSATTVPPTTQAITTVPPTTQAATTVAPTTQAVTTATPTTQTWPLLPHFSPSWCAPYESAPCNAYCVGLNGPTSYCKWWKNEPVCQGGDQSCGPSDCPTGTPAPTEGPPDAHVGPSSNCDAYCTAINPDLSFDRVSYCKWWLHVPVCYDGDQPCGPSVCSNFGETTTPTTSIPSVTPTTQATTISSATSQIVTTQSATTLTPTTQAVTTVTPTTQAVTTVAPTTQAVTTVAPTTQAVTTVPPTTQAVTTVAPTTQAVTTVAPTTPAGTTAAPRTQATTTPSSTSQTATTQSVTTVAATTQAATTVVATTQAVTSVEATTQAVTTVPPTTQVVTTVAPTTQVVTTVAPTTQAVTSVAPTTRAVTSVAPTTLAATTVAPTTRAVTSVAPTTRAVTSVAPTTRAVTSVAPTTPAVTSVAPTTRAVTSVAPTTLAATTVAPTTQASTTAGPTIQAGTTLALTTRAITTVVHTTQRATTAATTQVVTTEAQP
ncbi:conserved hypothetical protein [Perkinsus marinus ATCC 50983]|uniref:Uncharacterized protein n=1 Tax=Perkinsus marinus (strain ATCC 50983 / TXsc) TaxID=423536 RepID=C5L3S4_PERM5|nr:conserved hypothetical protein [Perkinsus marinus ATCC 50983]EER08653.1 conserved hypothetical protein [Perkinsus marinus ATCC 50983]|eukprot:XP_002776837.1 conserved hypothetical protein [Perkinsus marinus ATCC 50983]